MMTELEQKLADAEKERARLRDAHRAERREMEERQSEELHPLADRISELAAQVDAERSIAAGHPHEGKRVWREENIYSPWGSRVIDTKRVTGVVEVWRVGSAPVRGSRRPSIGSVIVRLLKKDGTPGQTWEYYGGLYSGKPRWKFEEEQ
jgi:hypothetical protein